MSDVSEEIRRAVSGTRPTGAVRATDQFDLIRAEVRSALLHAHVRLGGEWSWQATDDRILDVVDRWLESKRSER